MTIAAVAVTAGLVGTLWAQGNAPGPDRARQQDAGYLDPFTLELVDVPIPPVVIPAPITTPRLWVRIPYRPPVRSPFQPYVYQL
ncbi:MAG TPA: hypothetical protein ENN87_10710 [Phycisphaerales bacterium]|nr:hypothetical protein [Phycisphaerales bacterium]